ncbi:sterol desaturase family protein [Aquimarina sp. AD1]|uniref:sterol desaturase family protein n=1 Tax=Aquimarina sp. (strain AD1) TaxID=1714848 RepID=UPI001314A514|nr:sterol desaturase family protein [Aquimarina sp. AD1]
MDIFIEYLKTLPQGLIQGILFNGTIILIVYFLVWKKFAKRLKKWRIQSKQYINNKQLRRELKNALLVTLVGTMFSGIVFLLTGMGYTKIYTDISDYNLFFSFSGFFTLLVIDDTWFYWVHRLLHHPKIYKYVHREHHKSVDVNPFTSMSFHIIEAFLLTFWILPVSFLFPMYAPVLILLQLWGLLDNVKAHLGYELYPSWWNKSLLRFMTSSTHHNMHHSKFNGNYGLHFRFWDWLMGTEFKDYETTYNEIKSHKISSAE